MNIAFPFEIGQAVRLKACGASTAARTGRVVGLMIDEQASIWIRVERFKLDGEPLEGWFSPESLTAK